MNAKKVVLNILLDSVFLIVFNAIFFLIGGTEHSICSWIAYGFIHFAYIMCILTPILTRKSSVSALFGITVAGISETYFISEFIVGLISIWINPEDIRVSLCIQIVIAGIYMAILLINLISNEATADKLEKQEVEITFIKDMSMKVKALVDKADDKKANKAIEAAYDLIHSSPSKSNDAAKVVEREVANRITDLEDAVASKDKELIIKAANEVVSKMEERNRKVK